MVGGQSAQGAWRARTEGPLAAALGEEKGRYHPLGLRHRGDAVRRETMFVARDPFWAIMLIFLTLHQSIDSSPVSSHHEPRRLSNLYQYHNAPEVAPAAGLEYDDNLHPWSDKYPVVNASNYSRYTPGSPTAKEAQLVSHKPPLIIFGMKLRTFLVVFVIVVCVIIGASVGGALGRPKAATAVNPQSYVCPALAGFMQAHSLVSSASTTLTPYETQTTQSTTTADATSTYAAPVPTYSVLNDCPQSNNTVFTASAASSSSSIPSNFIRHCGLASPLAEEGAKTLSQAFVYSFDDCIDVCAGMNYWGGNDTCNVAAFAFDASRPANCFVGFANISKGPSAFAAQNGINVALLDS
ncbi:hypothetical protein ANO11243_023260 [Dothideomycetidae sp. 11243]|nr:hypothetical protein ANO11243_023260 [fungal sp. No.11243]